MILLISALILNVVKNIRREILNEVNQENQWIPETQATRGKDQLRKQRKPIKDQRSRRSTGEHETVLGHHPLPPSHPTPTKRRSTLKKRRRERRAPPALTNQDWGPKILWVQMKEEAELAEPFNFEPEVGAGAEAATLATTTIAATMIFKREPGKRSGTLSTRPRARSITCMTTEKAKAVRSGGVGAGAEEPFPEVGADSCSGNPAPAPNGPMTSSAGRKGRLKTTRVGQRTEKRRTIYSPPLSRGHSDGSSYPGGDRR